MKKLLEKLMDRWNVDHYWQAVVILFIFSISGMTVLYVRKAAFEWLGFNKSTPFWEEAVIWLVVVFPSYQVLFLLYGFILGQFEFVWQFEKKNLRRLKKLWHKFVSKTE